jgi:hypothetical protein
MRANENSSTERDLYPKSNPTPLFKLGQDRTAIAQLSALGTGSGIASEIQNGTSKTTSEIDDKNRLKEQFISSHTFHRTSGGRVQKITVKKQFKP